MYYKACLIMINNQQKHKVNYNKTYILIVKIMCFKMIFKQVAKKDLEIKQLDIITAFLNFFIIDRLLIYVEQSIDYKSLKDLVYLLPYIFYGSK